MSKMLAMSGLVLWALSAHSSWSADRLLGVQSARVMSQSMPWIAEETGIFRKYNLEFPLVYIGTSPLATAAMLGGDGQVVDVNLASLLFELHQFICCEPADHRLAFERDERNEVFAS